MVGLQTKQRTCPDDDYAEFSCNSLSYIASPALERDIQQPIRTQYFKTAYSILYSYIVLV